MEPGSELLSARIVRAGAEREVGPEAPGVRARAVRQAQRSARAENRDASLIEVLLRDQVDAVEVLDQRPE